MWLPEEHQQEVDIPILIRRIHKIEIFCGGFPAASQ